MVHRDLCWAVGDVVHFPMSLYNENDAWTSLSTAATQP
jgi:hypothetical protein